MHFIVLIYFYFFYYNARARTNNSYNQLKYNCFYCMFTGEQAFTIV